MSLMYPEFHVFVIAEIGINHNGNIDMALRLIDAAVEAGADAVKFQKRTPLMCIPPEIWDIKRQTPWGMITNKEYRQRIEFGPKDYITIDNYCRQKGILWFASPWDKLSVDFLENFEPLYYKVASCMVTDLELVEKIGQTGRPVIMSTGMSSWKQVQDAVNQLPGYMKANKLTLMVCTSNYPATIDTLHLNRIPMMQHQYPNVRIGYSGHESGLWTTLCAVAMGARAIERHITLDRSMPGSDQAASVEPAGFKKLVKEIRNFEKAVGEGELGLQDCEIPSMKKLRRK